MPPAASPAALCAVRVTGERAILTSRVVDRPMRPLFPGNAQ